MAAGSSAAQHADPEASGAGRGVCVCCPFPAPSVAAVGSADHQGLGGSSPEAQQLLAPHVANVSKGA
ncbi:hypothetical protein HaLaN_13583 [Haematococcus lacustris]|uniref:Uncharacterized protein n=1 Tax=Haematococcus lacustris TaxID=44745 RepID=A0A699Z649_HAELA|nr:hypothetical protein HaLaN_13583 [Haematococcus lacustris]